MDLARSDDQRRGSQNSAVRASPRAYLEGLRRSEMDRDTSTSACASSAPANPSRDVATECRAIYERSSRTVRCVECPSETVRVVAVPARENRAVEAVAGVAGASARRKYERRKAKDEARLHEKWGKLGGLAVTLFGGVRLDSLVSEEIAVLHDRRVPRSRANIDHIAITQAGIWVIDAKRYRGRPQVKIERGVLRPRVEKLLTQDEGPVDVTAARKTVAARFGVA